MSDKIKIGICTDPWKSKIFKKLLKKKGYEFEYVKGNDGMDVFSIDIHPDDLHRAQNDIRDINTEARKSKMN